MASDTQALGGRTTEVFAGVPVSDFEVSLDWYQRLFGCAPSFFPNDREAVWALAGQRWIYIIVDPQRAGGAIQTIMVDELEVLIGQIAGRGIAFVDEERPAENVRKVTYNDPDGNEISLGRVPSA